MGTNMSRGIYTKAVIGAIVWRNSFKTEHYLWVMLSFIRCFVRRSFSEGGSRLKYFSISIAKEDIFHILTEPVLIIPPANSPKRTEMPKGIKEIKLMNKEDIREEAPIKLIDLMKIQTLDNAHKEMT